MVIRKQPSIKEEYYSILASFQYIKDTGNIEIGYSVKKSAIDLIWRIQEYRKESHKRFKYFRIKHKLQYMVLYIMEVEDEL